MGGGLADLRCKREAFQCVHHLDDESLLPVDQRVSSQPSRCVSIRQTEAQNLARTLVSLQTGTWDLGKQELFTSQFQAHEATHGVSRVTQAVQGHTGIGSQPPDSSLLYTMHFHAFLTSVHMFF